MASRGQPAGYAKADRFSVLTEKGKGNKRVCMSKATGVWKIWKFRVIGMINKSGQVTGAWSTTAGAAGGKKVE